MLDYTADDQFDVVLMNPPYGGSEKADVKNHFPADLASSETADLFMSVIMYRLKPGGRAAVILPDGFLYRASLDKIGETTELSVDGCILEGSYTLSGCRHDLPETVTLPAGGGTLYARGTAPDMECRITCTVGAAADSYLMAGILWVDAIAQQALSAKCIAALYDAAEGVGQQLHTVAYSEHGDAGLYELDGDGWRVVVKHAARAAGEDDSGRVRRFELFCGRVPEEYFAVNSEFAHAARDELCVLRAAVDDEDFIFFFHYAGGFPSPPAVVESSD